MTFGKEQIEFAKKHNIEIFDDMSDEDRITASELISVILMSKGIIDCEVNDIGKMCESILDILNED